MMKNIEKSYAKWALCSAQDRIKMSGFLYVQLKRWLRHDSAMTRYLWDSPTRGDTTNSSAGLSFCTTSKWWEVFVAEPWPKRTVSDFPISPCLLRAVSLNLVISSICMNTRKYKNHIISMNKNIILSDVVIPVPQHAQCYPGTVGRCCCSWAANRLRLANRVDRCNCGYMSNKDEWNCTLKSCYSRSNRWVKEHIIFNCCNHIIKSFAINQFRKLRMWFTWQGFDAANIFQVQNIATISHHFRRCEDILPIISTWNPNHGLFSRSCYCWIWLWIWVPC